MATGFLDSAETIEAVDWYVSLQTKLGVSPTAAAQTDHWRRRDPVQQWQAGAA